MKNEIYKIICYFVCFLIAIFTFGGYLKIKSEINTLCGHKIMIVGHKVNRGITAIFPHQDACMIDFGKYGEYVEWNVGSCDDYETEIIRPYTDTTCH